MENLLKILASCFLISLVYSKVSAQESRLPSWAATVQNEFRVIPDIIYRQANGMELRGDHSSSKYSSYDSINFKQFDFNLFVTLF